RRRRHRLRPRPDPRPAGSSVRTVTVPERAGTPAARFVRAGFRDGSRAHHLLGGLGIGDGPGDDDVVAALARAADPDLALGALTRIAEAMSPGDRDELVD